MNEIGEATKFLHWLVQRSAVYRTSACLTLTAIHPDGKHRTPSRHIPLNQPEYLHDALTKLLETNRLGWGAYVAIGLRRMGLKRYQRGRQSDIVALPAVFVDVDNPSADTIQRLQAMHPQPSCITFTGGGYHAYWWLDEPLSDMQLARQILHGLQQVSGGDALSVVNSLRLVGSRNSKPHRNNALCYIVEIHDHYYSPSAFRHLLPRHTPKTPPTLPHRRTTKRYPITNTLNPDLLRSVTNHFIQMGYVQRGEWLSGVCIYPERHQHDDSHHSFGFNARSGYGNCYVCGSILLKDICNLLSIQPADYGGLYI